MNLSKHTSLLSPVNPSCSPLPRPPTSLSLCGAVGQPARPAGGSAKPGPGFGAWLLSVVQDPGPLRAEGWEQRVEGSEGSEEREESSSTSSEQYSSGSPSKSSNPNGETGFLCGEREKKGGGNGGRDRERERHGRQGKGKV